VRAWATQVLRVLVEVQETLPLPDYEFMCRCYVFLNDAVAVSSVVNRLLTGDLVRAAAPVPPHRSSTHPISASARPLIRSHPLIHTHTPTHARTHTPSLAHTLAHTCKTTWQAQQLLVHQICFELYENATQEFLKAVRQTLPRAPAQAGAAGEPAAASASDVMAVDTEGGEGGGAAMAWGAPPAAVLAEAARVDAILSGDVTIRLHLEFLFRNNKTDLAILRATKAAVETRVSALHSATVFAHGLMHAGTTVDAFLRDHLDWLARASNWAKFSAVATLGVINKARAPCTEGEQGTEAQTHTEVHGRTHTHAHVLIFVLCMDVGLSVSLSLSLCLSFSLFVCACTMTGPSRASERAAGAVPAAAGGRRVFFSLLRGWRTVCTGAHPRQPWGRRRAPAAASAQHCAGRDCAAWRRARPGRRRHGHRRRRYNRLRDVLRALLCTNAPYPPPPPTTHPPPTHPHPTSTHTHTHTTHSGTGGAPAPMAHVACACVCVCTTAVFETLKAILYTDSAVAGEAAGLAMGLVMLGTGKEAAVQEMVPISLFTYTHA
jgi:hypothetical protein